MRPGFRARFFLVCRFAFVDKIAVLIAELVDRRYVVPWCINYHSQTDCRFEHIRPWSAENILKTSLGLFFLLVCGVMGADACAQNTLGRDWAGACSGCHGTEGRSEGAIPPIAGMHKDDFVRLMMAFRDGTRAATVMHQHARGLSDEQIGAIGDYFASRSPR